MSEAFHRDIPNQNPIHTLMYIYTIPHTALNLWDVTTRENFHSSNKHELKIRIGKVVPDQSPFVLSQIKHDEVKAAPIQTRYLMCLLLIPNKSCGNNRYTRFYSGLFVHYVLAIIHPCFFFIDISEKTGNIYTMQDIV